MNKKATILFAGDFVPHGRTKTLVDNGEYDKIITNDVKLVIEDADYSVVNLEAPVTEVGYKPIKKVGPILSAGANTPDAIRFAGFKMAVLANNHMNDYGEEGILNTLARCEAAGLDTIGAGKNREEAAKYIIKEIEGRKVVFINCCEHEFSITSPDKPGCNPLDPIDQSYLIQEAKRNADFVIVIVHGGIEHYQLPSPRMQKTYRFFIDQGADVVINHHQHCYSGYEFYKGHPVIYGLGNFCFDWSAQSSKKWQEGYMVKLTIENKIELELIPYIQNDEEVGVRRMNQEESDLFYKEIERLNSIIGDSEQLCEEYESFLCRTDKDFRAVPSVYSGRIMTALCRKGLLPVLKSKYRFRRLWLNISCESHLDRLKHYLLTNTY